MATRAGGQDRVSTKAKLARELVVLGAVLSRAREQRKIKQSDLAAKLQLPASYLSKIEKGARRLDVIEFLRIAEAMEADPSDLIEEVRRELGSG